MYGLEDSLFNVIFSCTRKQAIEDWTCYNIADTQLRRYPEFKRNAVLLSEGSFRTHSEVAESLGIYREIL